MRVLIDSAALIWWFVDDPRLGDQAAAIIEDPGTEAFVSVASVWEIAVKRATGRIREVDGESEIPDWLIAGLMYDLPIKMSHALAAAALPRHHGDPFDRLIVAQARIEGMLLLTPDKALRQYDVPLIDARV